MSDDFSQTAQAFALPDPNALRTEIERAIQRNIKGLEFLSAAAPTVGTTPKTEILRRGTLSLYHYHPMADEVYRVPLLMVMATTNRAYIFDLAPGQSMVEYLLKQGYDVYVMDWNPPRADEKNLRFEDYVLDFIPDCVRHVQRASGEEDVSVLGYCMGGVLTAMYAATHPDGPAKNFVFFTTPVDFSEMKLFSSWSDRRWFDVDRLVDTLGNAPPEMLFSAFDLLRPASRTAGVAQLWEKLDNHDFIKSYRMFDRWSTEMLPLAGEYFRQTVKELMWDNKLFTNTLKIGGRRVDLARIVKPALHVVAQHDHIVPYGASKPLIAHIGSQDKEEVMLKGGHVSVAAGMNAVKRLWPKLDSWLSERSLTPSFPRVVACDGIDVTLRALDGGDAAALLAFAQAIPPHDLLFLPRDISEPKVIAAWVAESSSGGLVNLVALDGDTIVGCATIVRDPLSWSRHVGELRVVIASSMRGKGLGRKLMQACFGLTVDLGLEKLIAQMTVDQQGAIAVFQTMGFKPEALLHDHAKDRAGTKHDLVILAHDVARFQAQMAAYGVTDA